jgi:hypothetical protein
MKLTKPLFIIIAGLIVFLPGLLQAGISPGSISISGGPPTSPQLAGTTNWIQYTANITHYPVSSACESMPAPTNTIWGWSSSMYGTWVTSTNNPAYWTNVFTTGKWYTNVTTCTVEWQGVDCLGTNYDVSTNASVTNVILVAKLDSLVVISNAVQIDTNDCATVMTNGQYVILQVNMEPQDTNAANLALSVTGGSAVSGNPFQRKVSMSSSAKTPVIANCCGTSLTNNVWVIWANLTIKVSSTDTLDSDDKAAILNNGNWPTQNTTYGAYGLGGGNSLGAIDCLAYPDLNYAYTIGKMEAKAVLQPTGIGNIITNGWNMKRTRIVIAWDNGGSPSQSDPPPGVYDANNPDSKYLNPVNGDIFGLDAPGCSTSLPLTTINHTAEVYDNFYQYVTVNLGNGDQTCSATNTWSYTAQVDVDAINKVQLNSLSTSLITLPTSPHYPHR